MITIILLVLVVLAIGLMLFDVSVKQKAYNIILGVIVLIDLIQRTGWIK